MIIIRVSYGETGDFADRAVFPRSQLNKILDDLEFYLKDDFYQIGVYELSGLDTDDENCLFFLENPKNA